jgi:hypothetical protein
MKAVTPAIIKAIIELQTLLHTLVKATFSENQNSVSIYL